jgi:hypothetical protein
MAVGIDQLSNVLATDRRACRWDEQQPACLSQIAAGYGLDPDRSSVELDFHLAAAGQADPFAKCPRDYQASGAIDGCLHGNTIPRLVAAERRPGSALPP